MATDLVNQLLSETGWCTKRAAWNFHVA